MGPGEKEAMLVGRVFLAPYYRQNSFLCLCVKQVFSSQDTEHFVAYYIKTNLKKKKKRGEDTIR